MMPWRARHALRRYQETRAFMSALLWFGERLLKRREDNPAHLCRYGLTLSGYWDPRQDRVVIGPLSISGEAYARAYRKSGFWEALYWKHWAPPPPDHHEGEWT